MNLDLHFDADMISDSLFDFCALAQLLKSDTCLLTHKFPFSGEHNSWNMRMYALGNCNGASAYRQRPAALSQVKSGRLAHT